MEKIIVVGGGISGIITAINVKNDSNEVIVLERGDKPLKKLLITGNGKCNYFNDFFDVSFYNSNDKVLLSKIINDHNKKRILSFFSKIGIISRIKDGYYYPYSNQAVTVKNALLEELRIKNVKLITDCYVKDVVLGNKFKVVTNRDSFVCDKLVISTGSCAYPKTGSDGNGYNLAKSFGHTIIDVLPSLVGLVSRDKYLKELGGVRCEGVVSLFVNDKEICSEFGEVQFTDYGLSGICIFNISGLASKAMHNKDNVYVRINLVKSLGIEKSSDLFNFLKRQDSICNGRSISFLLDSLFNYKITNYILKKCAIDRNCRLTDLSVSERNSLCNSIINFNIDICGVNSFDKAQVCSGGVSLKEVNINTFESLLVKNLYFTGEVLDVDGKCGGYNIGFACLSAILVGDSIND